MRQYCLLETPLHIAFHTSPLGPLEIRSNGQEVTAILFTGWAETVKATAGGIPLCVKQCMVQLDEYFAGVRQDFDFPYAQDGTPFQQRVWGELEKIPFGATISYAEQTRRLGDMNAIRAVAAANGQNMLAIVVPCHRVLGSNGKLTGYAGGLDKKRWLLQHEINFSAPAEGRLF